MDTKPANFIDKTQEMANDRKIYFLNFGRTSPLYRSQNNIIWKTTNKATTTPPQKKIHYTVTSAADHLDD